MRKIKTFKLFESNKISGGEFLSAERYGNELNDRELSKIIQKVAPSFVGDIPIYKDDGCYYVGFMTYQNKFESLSDLIDYLYLIYKIEIKELSLDDVKNSIIDPSFDNNRLIEWASYNGRIEIVNHLLNDPRVDPSDDKNSPIRYASQEGHIEIVKLLLNDPRVNPSDDNNYAIMFSSKFGHTEIVKLLLNDPRVDLSENNNCIKWAFDEGHTEIVKLLLNDPRVRSKLSPREIKKYQNVIK